jgi:hypothetical protein
MGSGKDGKDVNGSQLGRYHEKSILAWMLDLQSGNAKREAYRQFAGFASRKAPTRGI